MSRPKQSSDTLVSEPTGDSPCLSLAQRRFKRLPWLAGLTLGAAYVSWLWLAWQMTGLGRTESGLAPEFMSEWRQLAIIGAWVFILLFGIVLAWSRRFIDIQQQYFTRLQNEQAHLQQILFHDELTGLPNRQLFLNRLEHAMEKVHRKQQLLALMVVDLDRLKQINEEHGHRAGDDCLIQVAQRLKASVRSVDTVARQAGDEFAIILEEIENIEDVTRVANRIIASLRKPFDLEGHEQSISVSIGITVYPMDEADLDTLRRNADVARYRAKALGGCRYLFYTDEMNEQSVRHLTSERNLRRALEEEQFELFYQPKVEAGTGQIVGMEALIRWQHPEQGMISPGQFIPALERNGLIVPVGGWVLRRACETNKHWQDMGLPPLLMSANVDPQQFKQPDFVEQVRQTLSETGLEPRYLEIEVTEGCLMEDSESSIGVLNELKAMGVSISVDDFGTGYSSLSYLKKFPIDTLKIDQAFIRQLHDSSDNAAIVTAIMALAHSLRLKVVAEGVETAKELAFLSALGCRVIQGYLFSKPLPEKQVYELIKDTIQFKETVEQVRAGMH